MHNEIDTDAIARFLKVLYPDREWKVYFNVDITSLATRLRISILYDGDPCYVDIDTSSWWKYAQEIKLKEVARAADHLYAYCCSAQRFKDRHLKEIAEAGNSYTVSGV